MPTEKKFGPAPHTQLGLSVLKSKEKYLLRQVKQLEYQFNDYSSLYEKARDERQDYETKLNQK